jgi:hypothetical protein
MGQHRPVQVFNLVMRDSIEERVQKTMEQKRSLFEQVFSGGDDEIALGSLGHQAFLDVVRNLVGEEAANPEPPAAAPAVPTAEDARLKLAQAGVQLLEALAAVMAESGQGKNGRPSMPPDVLERGATALATILRSLGVKDEARPADVHRNGP